MTLSDEEQTAEIRMVASEQTVRRIKATAAMDDQYQSLKAQISVGWPVNLSDVTGGQERIRCVRRRADRTN